MSYVLFETAAVLVTSFDDSKAERPPEGELRLSLVAVLDSALPDSLHTSCYVEYDGAAVSVFVRACLEVELHHSLGHLGLILVPHPEALSHGRESGAVESHGHVLRSQLITGNFRKHHCHCKQSNQIILIHYLQIVFLNNANGVLIVQGSCNYLGCVKKNTQYYIGN